MKPVQFKYANKVLQPSNQKYSSNVEGVVSLPVWTDSEQCVSCWKMSLRERLSALLFGRVWLSLLSGGTQYPVYVQASRGYLREVNARCYLRGTSWLGLLNTILGCVFNRVLVRCVDDETKRTVAWMWDRATDHPPEET